MKDIRTQEGRNELKREVIAALTVAGERGMTGRQLESALAIDLTELYFILGWLADSDEIYTRVGDNPRDATFSIMPLETT